MNMVPSIVFLLVMLYGIYHSSIYFYFIFQIKSRILKDRQYKGQKAYK